MCQGFLGASVLGCRMPHTFVFECACNAFQEVFHGHFILHTYQARSKADLGRGEMVFKYETDEVNEKKAKNARRKFFPSLFLSTSFCLDKLIMKFSALSYCFFLTTFFSIEKKWPSLCNAIAQICSFRSLTKMLHFPTILDGMRENKVLYLNSSIFCRVPNLLV